MLCRKRGREVIQFCIVITILNEDDLKSDVMCLLMQEVY